jgi:hypothetical protein
MRSHEGLAERVVISVFTDFLLVTSFALNFNQRKIIRERDGNKCNFPVPNHNCNGDKRLEINHIHPQKYLKSLGVDPDYPENLLTICQNSHTGDPSNGHHIEPIHPDVRDARKNYGKDKKSIEKAIKEQEEKNAERVIWWNTEHDRQQQVIAVRNSQKMDKKAGGRKSWWPFSK